MQESAHVDTLIKESYGGSLGDYALVTGVNWSVLGGIVWKQACKIF